ncbi:MAG: potassium-transporting ATPase subunit KdpC [Nocardioides sp.]|uniref:potassium-transporting ATPase subunit KdpC n=1 Tax=Nocardioides sp. TaxID=35761 RepID=UPI0039E3D123
MPALPAPIAQSWAALRFLIVATVLCGLAYPLVVTGVGQLAFRPAANGSLIEDDGRIVGSSLIGQSFTDADGNALPEYFQSRPSAAGDGYDPLASSASNLSVANPDFLKAVSDRRAAVAELDGVAPADVPKDAVLASGSGLDPHISPEYADEQIARVARARGLSVATVTKLVEEHTQGRSLGFVGEPRVNVLELNDALDALT